MLVHYFLKLINLKNQPMDKQLQALGDSPQMQQPNISNEIDYDLQARLDALKSVSNET